MRAPYRTPGERITRNITVEPDGCWLWTKCCDRKGYGRVQLGGLLLYAHRLSYEVFEGPIPEGLHLDHLCRVRHCVNPDHLEPVTCAENIRRSPIHHGAKTHCPAGHPYDEANTRRYRGRRFCITCNKERCRAFRERAA